MDERMTSLADRLAQEIHPELGQFVLDLAQEGYGYDETMARLRMIMTVAEAARAENKA